MQLNRNSITSSGLRYSHRVLSSRCFPLLPFIVMILTSFMKIVIVLSLLRSALGVEQAPPNQIINGVAFMLSLFVMYPTGVKMYEAANETIINTRAPIRSYPPNLRNISSPSPAKPESP